MGHDAVSRQQTRVCMYCTKVKMLYNWTGTPKAYHRPGADTAVHAAWRHTRSQWTCQSHCNTTLIFLDMRGDWSRGAQSRLLYTLLLVNLLHAQAACIPFSREVDARNGHRIAAAIRFVRWLTGKYPQLAQSNDCRILSVAYIHCHRKSTWRNNVESMSA